jgi:hypothetical protein
MDRFGGPPSGILLSHGDDGCHLTTSVFAITLQVCKMWRARHPNKEVEQALRHAERQGWRVEPGGSHAWGRMYCPRNLPECRCGEFCITSIWSTPRNAENHARQLRRIVDNCVFRGADECIEESSDGI